MKPLATIWYRRTLPSMGSRLSDIAAHAGVSTATVSRVLNDRTGVAETTRQAVLTSLDVLGYHRPVQLQPRGAGLIGLMIPELENPIFPMFAQVIESGLAQHGFTPLMCTRTPGGVSEEEYIDLLGEHGVAGIIFVSGFHADSTADLSHYHRLRDMGLPLAFINGYAEGIDGCFISDDDVAAMDLAVGHLVSLGHTAIGLAAGPERFVPAHRKVVGYRRAMRRRLGPEAEQFVEVTLFTVAGGQAAAKVLLDKGCTAIICSTDLMALGAVRAVRSRDLSVPEDISVVGYDDSMLMAYTDPPLTTVRQSVLAMGSAAVQALVDEIAGRAPTRVELLFAPELVVRGSTGSGPRMHAAIPLDDRHSAAGR